jgi:hypothetical protein
MTLVLVVELNVVVPLWLSAKALVQGDEKREPDAKHNQGDQEVAVGEDGFRL